MMRSFSAKNQNDQKTPKIITSRDVLEPLNQALLASRDVMISSLRTGRMACCIFNLQSHDYRANSGIPLETICRPTRFQFPIFHFILGVGAGGGWKVPGSNSQVCSWFTSLRPHFRNDEKGFGKFGPLAEGRGVSILAKLRLKVAEGFSH